MCQYRVGAAGDIGVQLQPLCLHVGPHGHTGCVPLRTCSKAAHIAQRMQAISEQCSVHKAGLACSVGLQSGRLIECFKVRWHHTVTVRKNDLGQALLAAIPLACAASAGQGAAEMLYHVKQNGQLPSASASADLGATP